MGVVLLLVFFLVVNLPRIAKCIVLSGALLKLPADRMNSNRWFSTSKLWGDVKRWFVLNFYTFLTALDTPASMCIGLWAACCWLHLASNQETYASSPWFSSDSFLFSSVRELFCLVTSHSLGSMFGSNVFGNLQKYISACSTSTLHRWWSSC